MENETKRLERYLSLIILALLLVGCLLVLRPFVSALLWALVLCISAWPLHARLLELVRGRRTLAAVLTTLCITLILLVPFLIMGFSLADNAKDLANATRKWLGAGPPGPPAWLVKVPVVGDDAVTYWKNLAGDTSLLGKELKRVIEPMSGLLVSTGGKLGGTLLRGLVEVAVSILIALFLFRDGAHLANRLTTGLERIAGDRSRHLLDLACRTVRGVVHGILGTALVQALMAGVGFAIAGVPGPALLALLTFFLSVVPMGPPLVWVPAVIWLFKEGLTGWAIFMLIWGFGVSSIDNVVKPWLISQGSNMPFLLILFGVVGGALAFGFIGVFLGPTLLALGYRLIEEWTRSAGLRLAKNQGAE